jgi:hypothetical protein
MTSEPARNEPVDAYLKRAFGDKPESRILQDSARAGDIARRLSAEPSPDGVVAPITTAIPASVAPIEYVMHVWTHKCTICNTEHKHSEIYGVNHLRSRTGYGAFVRNMSPVSVLEWQVPIKVHHITTRTTAGCFECLDAIRDEILPTLRLPPVPEAVVRSGATVSPTRPVAAKKGPLTTDDFML